MKEKCVGYRHIRDCKLILCIDLEQRKYLKFICMMMLNVKRSVVRKASYNIAQKTTPSNAF